MGGRAMNVAGTDVEPERASTDAAAVGGSPSDLIRCAPYASDPDYGVAFCTV